jgi:hypothetical protein
LADELGLPGALKRVQIKDIFTPFASPFPTTRGCGTC